MRAGACELAYDLFCDDGKLDLFPIQDVRLLDDHRIVHRLVHDLGYECRAGVQLTGLSASLLPLALSLAMIETGTVLLALIEEFLLVCAALRLRADDMYYQLMIIGSGMSPPAEEVLLFNEGRELVMQQRLGGGTGLGILSLVRFHMLALFLTML